MRRSIFILALLFLASSNVLAQNGISAEKLLEIDRVGSPVASPDGQTILFTVTDVSAEANSSVTTIYSQALKSTERVALTAGSGPMWHPNGQKIGFMRGGQLWEMNPDGTNPTQITNITGGISNVLYAPNGQFISF